MIRLAALAILFLAFLSPLGASAHEIKLTIYDDGMSCPGGCDAHVVINRNDNGTAHAFAPTSTASNPAKCVAGQDCTICFGHTSDSCMTAIYRGGGPPRGKFDFTPSFYNKHCGTAGIPNALAEQCEGLDAAVQSGRYDDRINCFETPENAACVEVVAKANAAQAADKPLRDLCLEMKEGPFNASQTDDKLKRSNGCDYSFLQLGKNSAGVTWRILMPGSCRPGTFVGRDGLDCCSADRRFAASVHPECTPYFRLP